MFFIRGLGLVGPGHLGFQREQHTVARGVPLFQCLDDAWYLSLRFSVGVIYIQLSVSVQCSYLLNVPRHRVFDLKASVLLVQLALHHVLAGSLDDEILELPNRVYVERLLKVGVCDEFLFGGHRGEREKSQLLGRGFVKREEFFLGREVVVIHAERKCRQQAEILGALWVLK